MGSPSIGRSTLQFMNLRNVASFEFMSGKATHLSTVNLCGRSAGLAGSLDLPETKVRKSTLSSSGSEARTSHSQEAGGWVGSRSLGETREINAFYRWEFVSRHDDFK